MSDPAETLNLVVTPPAEKARVKIIEAASPRFNAFENSGGTLDVLKDMTVEEAVAFHALGIPFDEAQVRQALSNRLKEKCTPEGGDRYVLYGSLYLGDVNGAAHKTVIDAWMTQILAQKPQPEAA